MQLDIQGYSFRKICLFSGENHDIYAGARQADQSEIVIKLLKSQHPNPDEIAALKHEYEILNLCSSIQNEKGVPKAYDLIKIDNNYGLILENTALPTLAEILNHRVKIDIKTFLNLAVGIAEVLSLIHQKKIIHKDLNPSNIMCDLDGKRIKIIDFESSTLVPREYSDLLTMNTLTGTISYISPEQTGRMNRGVDYRSDYYSLGIIFYQMLTGKLPFDDSDPLAIIHSHIALKPKSPHSLDPNIPQILSDLVMKLLEKNAENRYQNAYGLLKDLKKCLSQFNEFGLIESFDLGKGEVFNRFQIPEKLYGREKEKALLFKSFKRVARSGMAELILVSGHSGVGKSSLINEMHKPIVREKGYFVAVKFEKFKKNTPFYALSKAITILITQILVESKVRISEFSKKIKLALGENAKLMMDIIPGLTLLIGEQVEPVPLGFMERKNILFYLFKNLIKAMGSFQHPLVLFIDDLQWADFSSLNIISSVIAEKDKTSILIIGAYRHNEVADDHYLMGFIEEIKHRQCKITQLDLKPLNLENVEALIADTLYCQSPELAEISFKKTGGNPFFLTQFLSDLHKDNLFHFDVNTNHYKWDLEEVLKRSASINIVELMVDKIAKLPSKIQFMLQVASCIGSHFNLDLLAKLCNTTRDDILYALQEVVVEGYIFTTGEYYKATSFNFMHDRIQEAANLSLSEGERKQIHFQLATLLLKKHKASTSTNLLLTIADHYLIWTKGVPLERIPRKLAFKMANIHLLAAKQAKSAAASDSALTYINHALRLMDAKAWHTDYEFMFELYVEATENAYLGSRFKDMEYYVEIALTHANNILDEIKIRKSQLLAYAGQGKYGLTIDIGKLVLAKLGVEFPTRINPLHIISAMLNIKRLTMFKPIASLIDLPEMSNELQVAKISLLRILVPACYRFNSNLFALVVCKMVTLCLQYGNTKEAYSSYAAYGTIQSGFLGNYELGYQLGKLSLDLINHRPGAIARSEAETVCANASFIMHWKAPVQESISTLVKHFARCFELGTPDYAAYSIMPAVIYMFLAGYKLPELLLSINEYKLRAQSFVDFKNFKFFNLLDFYGQKISQFIEQDNSTTVSPKSTTVDFLINQKDKTILFVSFLFKLIQYYQNEDYQSAYESLDKSSISEKDALGTFIVPTYHFYIALIHFKIYKSAKWGSKVKIRKVLKRNLALMRKWSKFAPGNHLQKYELLAAEWEAVVSNKPEKAALLYEKALKSAKINGFLNDEAVIRESAAQFNYDRGQSAVAQWYMEGARYCYLLWGATAKVAQLDTHYHLSSNSDLHLAETESFSRNFKDGSQSLQIQTLLKFSQRISSSLDLKDVLQQLMHFIMESAGAEKSYLLLNQNNQYFIEAEGSIGSKKTKVLESREMHDNLLPISLINYVANTKETLRFDNAVNSTQFLTDNYIKTNKLKSVCCIPLLNKGICSGIIYMENNLAEGVFTKKQQDFLYLLSSQIAICIDNAKLFSQTNELNKELVKLNQAYESFVPHDILNLLNKKDIVEVKLGDHIQKVMTVMFVDIRNFTHLSETLTPQQNFDFVNDYLSIMSPIIRKYNGFVDKYIGDAIMAIYPVCADDAVQCALEMLDSLAKYNKQMIKKGQTIAIGIGINTGSVMLGTIGEVLRMNATVISDAVNIASRVQYLTKKYKTNILITDATRENLKNPSRYPMKVIEEQVIVRGKTKSLKLYKLGKL
ncbi:MAG: AAA family ATPase [Tatlockia sp.]|nr:AAA family ATPase [Tatlockia sp.]